LTTTINASTTAGLVQTADTSGLLALQTAGVTAVTVNASQNVGIGETNPTQILHMKGSSTTYALAETTGTGTSSGFRMKAGAGTDFTLFTTQGGNQFGIYNNTTSTQPLTINANGALALLGASTSATGVGITFPATQSASTDANTLDDYEEGTWTATLTGSTAAPTVPVTSTTAIYTKIGRSVQLNLNFDNVSVVGATGDALVTGVPFAGGTVAGHGVVGINSFGSSVLFASIFNAVTQIALRNSITTVFAPITSGTTGIYITCGITYSV
jgi:hypothetical protein